MFEQTKAVNDAATRSPILGFAVDQEPIKLQMANCRAVLDEFGGMELGIVDPEVEYPRMIEKLKVAGVDELIANLNEQLKAWLKENK